MKGLFFDLDDTLLNPQKQITKRTRQAIIQCKELGMVIGYITVRSPRKMRDFLQDLPCDCIANYNGAMISANGQLVEENVIPYSEGVTFVQMIQKRYPQIELNCYCQPYCYRNGTLYQIETKQVLGERLDMMPPTDFQRIRIVYDDVDETELSSLVPASMLCQCTVHKTAIITNRRANKGHAIHTLMEQFHLKAQEVISFGDDTNDIEMLRVSGIGVAMGNALQEVKDIADYVTLSNEEDGVAYYLEKFILSKE